MKDIDEETKYNSPNKMSKSPAKGRRSIASKKPFASFDNTRRDPQSPTLQDELFTLDCRGGEIVAIADD